MTGLVEHLDSHDSLNLRIDGLYERNETEFVKRHLKAGQVFVDCGAHIGYYTTLAALLVGPTGRVYAFEPDPDMYELLMLNVSDCRAGITVSSAALSDHVGRAAFYPSTGNSGDGRLHETVGRTAVEVDVTTLDEALANVPAIDFLKIDVQGDECRVLRGGRAIIDRSPSLIGIIEYAPKHLELSDSSGRELLELIRDMGFKARRFVGKKLVDLSAKNAPKPPCFTNLIITRRPR